ncbi:MAG: hypothetical protein JKY19_13680 [Alcanivoracaceae bacterium]|nr:hypothetical protein [Alcanivoracaceae bacterium]
MNASIIKQLILKDWYFNRLPLLLFTIIAVLSLGLFSINAKSTFYIGLVLIISLVVTVGALLIFSSVVNERKNQTLAFIMSLPLSFLDYTKAKIISNLSVFLVFWSILVTGILLIIYYSSHLPNGLIPISVIIMGELLVSYVLVLAVALIKESETWTIVVMGITNVGISLFMFLVAGLSDIGPYIEGPIALWNSTAISIVIVELILAISLIGIIFYLQSRKKDYL